MRYSVKVLYAPISERYWDKGDIATVENYETKRF